MNPPSVRLIVHFQRLAICTYGKLIGGGPIVDLKSGGRARNDLDLTFKVVKKPPSQVGFKVLPRRWIVERSLSWLMRARRNARDYERLPEHSEAHITWANITLMTRRLTRPKTQQSPSSALLVA
jgi:Transposase DDE domain